MGFEEFVKEIEARGYKLECPFACSAYGILCNGNPYETPCGRSIVVDADGNEVEEDE